MASAGGVGVGAANPPRAPKPLGEAVFVAPTQVYVGLGSNLDDPQAQVRRAIDELAQLPDTRREAVSGLYRTPPMGPPGQPDYINAVAALTTRLDPHRLLDELQAIERAHDRVRAERWGPRTLDLDILLYGQQVLDDERLVVPHPGIAARAFVLLPLAEIAPDLLIPGLGAPAALLAQVNLEGISRL